METESTTEPELANAESPPASSDGVHPSAAELVAKAIAPVKKEFLRPPPSRSTTISEKKADDNTANDHSENDGVKSETSNSIVKEKKSKRQLKRERREERKSALNLCPEVAKTEVISSCRYGDKCRFSHDLEAYKSQRPPDLEGQCPFNSDGKRCPYGVTCRFSGTHRDGTLDETSDMQKDGSEVNVLKKDVQKLLWKNKMKFPKSNSALKQLGLVGRGSTKVYDSDEKVAVDKTNVSQCLKENNCVKDNSISEPEATENNFVKDNSVSKPVASAALPEESSDQIAGSDESRPLKKAKCENDEKCGSDEVKNGVNPSEEDCRNHTAKEELQSTNDYVAPETDASLKLQPREKKLIDFRGKLYLAPLTTVGNLPYRRVCKVLGADVTCGEMAMCTNLLQGQASEWALLRRHTSEDLFGVQICGAYPDTVARAVELIDQECSVDFIDINMGCPIDIVVNKGAGSALINKPLRMKNVIQAACASAEKPITVKVRTGYFEGKNRIDAMISDICDWGASALTIHGRTRQQRYSKLADWEYIYSCVKKAPSSFQVLGNGDVFSYLDWNKHLSDCPELSSCMIARGALIKPWIFTEIKERRHWDISSGERLDILKDYVRFGLEHWGSDSKGVETTRHFLLEWLSYTCRYIPVGLLDVIPQRLNWRPPSYYGRDDLETLMASDSAADWIRISEMLLGKVPPSFTFAPKHKSNAYDSAENG